MKILIVRHAEPDYSIDSLTPKGWREAELLSRRLSRLRARDTARATLDKLGREATILPWLREFPGKIQRECDAAPRIPWNLEPQYWTGRPLLFDREGWLRDLVVAAGDVPETYTRTVAALDGLLAEHGYRRDGLIYRCAQNTARTLLFFCHFAVGMVLISRFTGIAPPLLWQGLFMPASSVSTVITEERVKGEVFWKVQSIGDTSHLYAADEPVSRAGLYDEVLP